MAELIRAGLMRGQFNPDLVLVHLTPKVLAENVKSDLVWACIADSVTRHFEFSPSVNTSISAAPQPAPTTQDATGPINLGTTRPSPPPALKDLPKPAPARDSTGAVKLQNAAKIEPVVARPKVQTPPPKNTNGSPWSDDIDVIEEQPLPPPPIAR